MVKKWAKEWLIKFSRRSFDKKMQWIVTVTITLTALLILSASTISSVTSMKKQSVELLQAQNNTVAENFRSSLENYKSLAIAAIIDDAVQQYAKRDRLNGTEATKAMQNAYSTLDSINNMYSDLNFIALAERDGDSYLFKGKENVTVANFLPVYRLDEQNCKTVQDSTIKMCFNNAYYNGEKYTWNIYFPIYDTEKIFRELGLLCISFTDPNLVQILEYNAASNTELFVVDADGMLVASRETEQIGQYVDYMEDIRKSEGIFSKDGNTYIFHKVPDWNFYVVSSVPNMEMYRASIGTVVVLILMLGLILFVSVKVIRWIIVLAYRPLDKVVKKMDDVASGELKTRINVENMGEDFTKLAVGFNSMMEEILVLMEKVKLEQHQVEQIRFNALQSQIHPHFLYNTLECIHWQAVADGNQEVSTLVKALAKYYRICLSNGRDVIPLSLELEHVQNYLIIQNMRYDHIIDCVFDVDDAVVDAMIPKLTLQPLVENSIYHGIKVKEGKTGTMFISAKREGEVILITVSDTGTGMAKEDIDEMNQHLAEYTDSFGYGVRNVNKRMELLFGAGYGLHFLKGESGGVTVEIRIPYVTEVKDNILRGEPAGV